MPTNPDGDTTAAKLLQAELNTSIQWARKLFPSRERAIVITKLQEAVMWLAEELKRIEQSKNS